MKKIAVLIMLCFCTCLCFSQPFSISKDGNACIFSYNALKSLHEQKDNIAKYTANELSSWYDRIRDACGNNELLFEQKKETEFANHGIVISGYVYQVRKSILDEYIVELNTSDFFNVGVVYPKKIPQVMVGKLMNLKRGDYFEAIVCTRSTYLYVDVPVWNQNGVYRTEP